MTDDALIEELQRLGHWLIQDDEGMVDRFQLDYDIHNGPKCLACKRLWCLWCKEKPTECTDNPAAGATDR